MEVIEAEEVGSLLEEVQQAVLDPQRFCRTVKLKGFQPFTTAENALENVNAISEQMVTDDLKVRDVEMASAMQHQKQLYRLLLYHDTRTAV